jgi:hypothetical protein
MKITKEKLKTLIKEEMEGMTEETGLAGIGSKVTGSIEAVLGQQLTATFIDNIKPRLDKLKDNQRAYAISAILLALGIEEADLVRLRNLGGLTLPTPGDLAGAPEEEV